MDDPLHIAATTLTHRGRVRESNEDSVVVAGWVSELEMSAPRHSRHALAETLLFAVADGLGGHACGEIASRHTVKRLGAARASAEAGCIAALLGEINADLYAAMRRDRSLLGMGTTVAGLVLSARHALWFNVGDSRIYRERGGRIEQLSIDDVPPGPRSGIITQTLGGGMSFVPVAPHIGVEHLSEPGSLLRARWLLCSDGLTDMLDDAEIERALAASDEEAVGALFAAAIAAGGHDNISIVLVSAGGG
jgi:serine/threonine protein phosphatase PrpC